MIDYSTKITCVKKERNIDTNIDWATESNRGRIVNSPAIRRLQQKTQVFPLEINAAVRSRLTHSLEVQQNARYLARSILGKLEKENKINDYKLNGLEHAFVSTSEMASLMHDIGNPPFGHFGELAINEWMKENIEKCFNDSVGNIPRELTELTELLHKDISNFEGNAQGIRIVHTLQDLNLTFSQTASILKYTRAAYEDKPDEQSPYSYLKKKPGYFFSEEEFIKELINELNINEGCRFPLTYIMEAADDISYGIADLEDAVDKGILSLKKLYESIINEADKLIEEKNEDGQYIKEIAYKKYNEAKKEKYIKVNKFIVSFRVTLANELVDFASDVFIQNHNKIFNGTYNKALLEGNNSKYDTALKVLKNVATKYVFKNSEVEALELKGKSVIKGLFTCYREILSIKYDDFKLILNDEKNDFASTSRLFRRLSNKHINAYVKSLAKLEEKNLTQIEFNIYEWYYRTRLLIDFITGMTDEYTIAEYQLLTGIK
ncbi:dGTPase [Sulfurimonas sp.]|uniref:dGTPase n=1 Tax=Sulfurimonas sp. TaxID=2022749 RepID=UPI002AB2A3A6|nr:dGTPase [Sulfurimonas sp.]